MYVNVCVSEFICVPLTLLSVLSYSIYVYYYFLYACSYSNERRITCRGVEKWGRIWGGETVIRI